MSKIGFTCSSFDLLHAGHVAMLKESKHNCDYLIVGLNTDPIKNNYKCIQTVFERYTQLAAIKYVDEIIPYSTESELINIFHTTHIDVRFIGDDYKSKNFTAQEINEKNNTELFFNRRQHHFSSSNLIKKILSDRG